jgi:hypothetical protein
MVSVVAVFVIGGAGVGYGLGQRVSRPYTAALEVRSSVADGSCVVFSCPSPAPGPLGIAYVLDQVNTIQESPLAQAVQQTLRQNGTKVSVPALEHNVRAREVGGSTTITIAFSNPSRATAVDAVREYARQYVLAANGGAIKSLQPIKAGLEARLKVAAGSQKAELASELDRVEVAMAAYAANQGPNGASPHGAEPVVTRGGFSERSWSLLGGAIGGLLAIVGIMTLAVKTTRRRTVADESQPEELSREELEFAAGTK